MRSIFYSGSSDINFAEVAEEIGKYSV